ncbi:MAG: hypothetical protein MZW92_41435 [Comamonadaceae bacterium]|nr:hypothetical protein [Comamonadaceae bacterium]
MTVEQAQVFALQRCTHGARGRAAHRLADGDLRLPALQRRRRGPGHRRPARGSGSMEICSVGPDWTPGSGKPGAIWAARRVPDDQVVGHRQLLPHPRDRPRRASTRLASPNVHAARPIDRGWYDPEERAGRSSGRTPTPRPSAEGSLSRIWLVYQHARARTSSPGRTQARHGRCRPRATLYAPAVRGRRLLPVLVVQAESARSRVQDVIAFQRSAFAGHDLRHDLATRPWMVRDRRAARMEKSPMASPFISSGHARRCSCASADHRTIATAAATAWSPSCASWLPGRGRRRLLVLRRQPLRQPLRSRSTPACSDVLAAQLPGRTTSDEFSERLGALGRRLRREAHRSCAGSRPCATSRPPVTPSRPPSSTSRPPWTPKPRSCVKGDGGSAAAADYLTGLTVSRMEKLVGLYRSLRKTLLAKYSGDGV